MDKDFKVLTGETANEQREEMIFKQLITPISRGKWEEILSEGKESVALEDLERYPTNKLDTYIINNKSIDTHKKSSKKNSKKGKKVNHEDDYDEGDVIYPLTAGYYLGVCSGVLELPDERTLVMGFTPFDKKGNRHTDISFTLSKRTRKSEALGEFIFAMGGKLEEKHSCSHLVIEDVDAFRELVDGKEFGIEVSMNFETGWLYITDFFNLMCTDEFPTCPDEIIRNVF